MGPGVPAVVASGAMMVGSSGSPPVMASETAPPVDVGDHERRTGSASTSSVRQGGSLQPTVGAESAEALKEPAQSWASLVVQGRHARVLDEADAPGIDGVIATATEADLNAVADAARYAGRRDLARRALLALRSRFGSTPRAASPAFLLG